MRSLIVLLLALAPLRAQNITGAILGTVTDKSGAAVANAEVTVTNTGTNQSTRVATNTVGAYEVPQIPPGDYAVKVTLAGFNTAVRKGLQLVVEQHLRIDFTLDVGDTATSISVTADAPLIDSESGSLGQVVGSKELEELPIKGRNVFDLAILTPGVSVNPLALGAVASTGDNTAPLFVMSDISINGGRYRTNDYLLDGVSIMLPENNNFALSPTPDGTQEFKVMTNSYGPQFGRSGGGVLNVITKSGTNKVHGSLFEFFRNDWFKANNFFSNAAGQHQAPQHSNLFGGSVGAPILRNKTFVFADYQGHRSSSSLGGQFATLPTAAEREGDFSALTNSTGQKVGVYDPHQTQSVNGVSLRVQFPNNVIPRSTMDPVALKMLSYIPLPNKASTGLGIVNNYVWAQQAFINSDQWSVRIDHRFSERQNFFGRFTRNKGNSGNTGPFNNAADNVLGVDINHVLNGVLNDTFLISPRTILNVRYGVTRRLELRSPIQGAIGLASLGFPATYASQAQQQFFPVVGFTGYSSWGDPGGDAIRRGNDIHTIVADQTLIRGRHTIVYGTDIRLYNQTPYQAGSDSGNFSFSPSFTQQNPLQASLTSGDAFASFLTGYGSGSVTTTPSLAMRNMYYALYFNDTIRLRRLTVSVGLRWDDPQPPTERYDRFATFDADMPFPIKVAAFPNLKGTLLHPGQRGVPRTQFDPYYKAFGPRIGLSYSINPKTVIRSGYGIFYAPRIGATSASGLGTTGSGTTTTWVTSSNDGIGLVYPLSNPFPNGLANQPQPGDATYYQLGQSISVTDPKSVSNTYNQQWNFNIQHQFGSSFLLEVGYAGNKGTHLPIGLLLDQLYPGYQSLGTQLSRSVANPFYGLVTNGTLSLPTVAYNQLLRPYPQYAAVNTNGSAATAKNIGDSNYHSLQIKAQKRFSKGLSFLVSYTKAKSIDDSSGRLFGVSAFVPPVQDVYNLSGERSISEGDVAQQLVFTHSIDLPFAKNRLYGGWTLGGTATFSSGFPLVLTSTGNTGVSGGVTRPNNNGTSAHLEGDVEARLNRYFNTSAFSVPVTYTFGNTARSLPDTRSPGRVNYDMNLNKRFRVREGMTLNLRAEAFNLTNSPYFRSPGVGLGTTSFGVISSSLGERQMQFALKLLF